MKKISFSLAAVAGLVAVGGALAFTPHAKFHNNFVFVKNGVSPALYTYSNLAPVGLTCKNIPPTSALCTISTTGTAAYFNANFSTTVPVLQSHTSTRPAVTALIDPSKIYQ